MRLINAYAVRCDRDEFDTYADYIKAFDAINEAPTVDAVPVRHGKWIPSPTLDSRGFTDMFKCSECGWRCNDLFKCDSDFNFCPNCGAMIINDD